MSKAAAPRNSIARHSLARQVHDACLCLHVQRAARALARRFDEAFRPLGITHGQFSLLMSLNRDAPARIGAIATLLAIDRTTLTANLKPLARRGLVKVDVEPDDRRSRMLALTSAGRKLLATALPIWKRSHGELERKIANTSDPDRLRSDLRALA